MSSFHKLRIKTIHQETPDAISVSFELPEDLKDTFAFKAGQYITLKATVDGRELRRDYSLCTAPEQGLLKIAIKQVEDGLFSVYANTKMREGDSIEVGPPRGRFVFEPNDSKTKHIAVFAAGSGITPVLSIVKCALKMEQHSNVILVYGNKTPRDTLFLNELLELQHRYKERFSIEFIFSQKNEADALFGRIESSTVNYVMKNKYKHITIDAAYLCGPEGMIHTVKDVLSQHGMAEEQIHFELFKAAKPAESDTPIPTATGKTQLTILVDEEETTIEMPQKQTVLEAALDADLEVPYSCQGGICSSCLARIKSGEATMRQNNILTTEEVNEGLILTCQAQPTSPTLVVDFDDV